MSVYKSSAGSGKTTELTSRYIALALKGDFKNILAVTFTNKATNELKERVIKRLYDYSQGKTDPHHSRLLNELKMEPEEFKNKCEQVMHGILFNYGMFSISTIDTFFQRIIKSFAREAGIQGNLRVELSPDEILREALGKVIGEAGRKKELTSWLTDFAHEQLEQGRSNNLVTALDELGKELFKEEFKVVKAKLTNELEYQKIVDFRKKLRGIISGYESELKDIGNQGLQLLNKHGLTFKDLINGVGSILTELATGEEPDLSKSARAKAMADPEKWVAKAKKDREWIVQFADQQLKPLVIKYQRKRDNEGEEYHTALAIDKNYKVFGLLSELLDKIKVYKDEEDIMLLSDSPEFLHDIIQGNDSPFIYEKVGTQYHHFLIDEFQDTSQLQWSNFKPLVGNAVSQGFENMLVGDVKQSIYRWRGGDWNLLDTGISQEIPGVKEEFLTSNYRSTPAIINFNNEFFKHAIRFVQERIITEFGDVPETDLVEKQLKRLAHAYSTYKQEIPKKEFKVDGFVNVELIEAKGKEYKKEVHLKVKKRIEELQHSGLKASEIAILVRENKEAAQMASYLFEVAENEGANAEVNYKVVSNEALMISSSPAVNFFINAMRLVLDPENDVAKMVLVSEYYQIHDSNFDQGSLFEQLPLNTAQAKSIIESVLKINPRVAIDLVEELIRLSGISKRSEHWPFVMTFMDALQELSKKGSSSISSILDWWEEKGKKMQVVLTEGLDAIQILSIHKAKGLEYKAVIIPYCDWALYKGSGLRWTGVPQSPFNEFSAYPISITKDLVNSYLREFYINEVVDQLVDNLNLLYVALTRPMESLDIFAPVDTGHKLSASILNSWEALVDGKWQVGETRFTDQKSSGKHLTIGLGERLISNEWRNRIQISQKELLKLNVEVYEKLVKGRKIHSVLEQLKDEFDPEDTIQSLSKYNEFSSSELNTIHTLLVELKEHPVSGKWFRKGNRLFSENTLISKNGQAKRPDLIVETPGSFVVVDYKTGETSGEHGKQVSTYCQILKEIEGKPVEGYLIYLLPLKIIQVV